LQVVLVSVVIPTRNRPDILIQAINSVVLQDTTAHVEVIVVDSGNTIGLKDTLRQRFPEVRYFNIKPAGPAMTRQFGSERARGEYLAYLDDDDVYLPQKLRIQLEFLEKYPEIDLCYCDTQQWDGTSFLGKPRHKSYPQIWDCSPVKIEEVSSGYRFEAGSLYKAFLLGLPMYPQSIMIRRQFFEKMGGWNEDISGCGECHDFSLRATHHGCVGYQDTALFLLRRQHGMHMTHDWCEAWKEEANMIESLYKAYPVAMRNSMQPYLKDYFAMTGWRMFNANRFDLAKRLYYKAFCYGYRSPKMMLKWLLSTLHANPVNIAG